MEIPEVPSFDELNAGRMNDGSRPPMYSGMFVDEHPDNPLPETEKDALDCVQEDLLIEIERQRLAGWNDVENYSRFLMEVGYAAFQSPGSHARGPETVRDKGKGEAPDETNPSPSQSAQQTPSQDRRCSDEVQDVENEGGDEKSVTEEPEPGTERRTPGTTSSGDVSTADPSTPLTTGAEGEYEKPLPGGRGSCSDGSDDSSRGYSLRDPDVRLPHRRQSKGGVKIPDTPHDKPQDELERSRREVDRVQKSVDEIANRRPRERSRRARALASELDPVKALALGEKGARMLACAIDKRAECARNLVRLTMSHSRKQEFYYERAHGVVYAMLCHLDETFADLGFAGWMPFRHPDQWLMFCGVMRRVLAANGLIHSEHADVYRKLLEETPPVEHDARPPQSWAKAWRGRGIYSLEELQEEIEMHMRGPPRF